MSAPASSSNAAAANAAVVASSTSSSALPMADQLTLLQFRYTAALEKLVHANDQVAKLAEDKAVLIGEKAELQARVVALSAASEQAQHQQQHAGAGGQQGGQGDFQLDPSLSLPGYGVAGPSSHSAYAYPAQPAPAQQQQQLGHGHRQIIYVPQPPPGPTQQQLDAARVKYGAHWDPFDGLSEEELQAIRDITPNWDAKHLTRKSIWSELTDRHGHPVMRKPYPNEDPKAYSAEKSKCQEWHRIFVLAREIVKGLLVPGTTWTEQNDEMRAFAVKAVEQKVEQVRWCQDHWKAQILLDSRLVEWNRSWKDKQAVLDGLGSHRRAKRRRLAKDGSGGPGGAGKKDDGSGLGPEDDQHMQVLGHGHDVGEDEGDGGEEGMLMVDEGEKYDGDEEKLDDEDLDV